MRDAWSVARKEWLELLGENSLQGRQGILLMLATFGLLLPLMNGREWITSPLLAASWSWVPMFLVSTVIADAFAGERERHTLETLLATRLSEPAILFGKIGAAILYAGALCAASAVLGVIVVNLANRETGLLLYPWRTVAAVAGLGVVGAVFVGTLGAIFSLRAPTARQAQQTLSGAILVIFLGPMLAIRWLKHAWPEDAFAGAQLGGWLATMLIAAMVLVDVGLVLLALSRFRRSRIIAG